MKKAFLVILMIGLAYTINAQEKRGLTTSKILIKKQNSVAQNANPQDKSTAFENFYGRKENYIPRPGNQNYFYKTIHVSIHIWQRKDGSGNIDNTPENIARLRQVEEWMNNRYFSSNKERKIPLPYETEFIEKPMFRLVLDSIYFYQDTTADSSFYYCRNDYQHNVRLDKYLKENYPERTHTLPLHLVRGHYTGAWGYSHKGSILTLSYANGVDMNITDKADWALAQHWSHEIGHGLDLWHTYDARGAWKQNCKEDYVDFLWDVYDTTAVKPCGDRGVSCDVCLIPVGSDNNNLMGGKDASFKSALQIGIMHRSTVLENQYNRGFGMRDYVTGYNINAYSVSKDEVWDFSMKMYQDLIIKPGVTLVVKSEIQFVPDAKIVIRKGGKLIVDGGTLTNENFYNSTWRGVEIRGKKKRNKKKRGVLEVINGGKIENTSFSN